jgi:hypothetical protein
MATVRLFVSIILLPLAIAAQPGFPNPADFAGRWNNVDPSSGGLTRVEITPVARGVIRIHAWGRCAPQDCDWGETEARAASGSFSWELRDNVALRRSTVLLDGDQLVIRMLHVYHDNRPQRAGVDRFQRAQPAKGTRHPAGQGEPAGIIRRLNPDGSAEIRYPDGTVKTVTKSGVTIRRPDGTMSSYMYSQVPGTFPVLPTDQSTITWLSRHADSLLAMIRTLTNDEAAVNSFVQNESNMGLWERIQWRSDALNFLLTPQ